MDRKKPRLGIVNEHSWRWKGSGDVDRWAVQDKKGDWWLVAGSEFAEKKLKKGNGKEKRTKKTSGTLMQVTIITLAFILGVSLALNLFFSLGFFN